MDKTSSHIEVVSLASTIIPDPTIVRPPAYLKVVRCTVIFQCNTEQIGGGYLSTVSDQNIYNTIFFSNGNFVNAGVPPSTDTGGNRGITSFVFDRLGVGYMQDQFYVSGEGSAADERFIFIWEGIIQST